MQEGWTFKDVCGRANVVTVVHVAYPIMQLMAFKVAKYVVHIGHISTIKLPLWWDAPIPHTTNRELGTSSNLNPTLIDIVCIPTEYDGKDTLLDLSPWSDASSKDFNSFDFLSTTNPNIVGARLATDYGAQSACHIPVMVDQPQRHSDAANGYSTDVGEYVPWPTYMRRP